MLNKETPSGKGLRTAYQAIAGTVVAFFYGLWNLPGVPEYVTDFLKDEGVSLLLLLAVLVGVPAGVIAWVQNKRGM